MPLNKSFGVFPSQTAVRSRSVGDLQRLYFSTTVRQEHDWRTIPAQDRGENFNDVHNVGKRTTKYMKFQKKVAPLVDRTACRYNAEFIAKPLGDYQCNKELALTFAGSSKVSATPSFGNKSSYKETFVLHSDKQMKGARQKSCAPGIKKSNTLGGTDDFMEPESLAHRTYMTHPMELAKATPAMVPKPNLTMSSQPADLFKSQYNRNFGPSPAPPPEVRWEDYMPEHPPWVLADDSIYRARRACFLSPGN